MGWDHLQRCTVGGVELGLRSARGSVGRDLVSFRYPGRDGAEHQDLGRREQRFSLDVVFHDIDGRDYRAAFDELRQVMDDGKVVAFVHPHHGEYSVRVAELNDTTSERGARFIRADLELVEDTGRDVAFTAKAAGLPGAANLFDTAAAAATTALAALP